MRAWHSRPWMLAVGLWLLVQSPAQADVWGFMDAQGNTHFSAERLDARYALYFYNPDAHQSDVIGQQKARDKLLNFFEKSPGYKKAQSIMQAAALEHGVEYELLQALVATESGFDAKVVSPRGAVGLMQLMPNTASEYGLSADNPEALVKQLLRPETNISVGARYLRDLLNKFPGRLDLALAAYNAGVSNVRQAGDKVPPFRETQAFVKTVMQLHVALQPVLLGANPHHLPIHNFRLKQSRALNPLTRLSALNP
jgi:soluble lytic murein transglycosylase-like protein